MPCNSDHMNPTPREAYNQRTAQLLVWVLTQRKLKTSRAMRDTAADPYALEDYTQWLCDQLKGVHHVPTETLLAIRCKEARRLADWWEEHQAADKEREEKEAKETQAKKLVASALAKLTKAERLALGYNDTNRRQGNF